MTKLRNALIIFMVLCAVTTIASFYILFFTAFSKAFRDVNPVLLIVSIVSFVILIVLGICLYFVNVRIERSQFPIYNPSSSFSNNDSNSKNSEALMDLRREQHERNLKTYGNPFGNGGGDGT